MRGSAAPQSPPRPAGGAAGPAAARAGARWRQRPTAAKRLPVTVTNGQRVPQAPEEKQLLPTCVMARKFVRHPSFFAVLPPSPQFRIFVRRSVRTQKLIPEEETKISKPYDSEGALDTNLDKVLSRKTFLGWIIVTFFFEHCHSWIMYTFVTEDGLSKKNPLHRNKFFPCLSSGLFFPFNRVLLFLFNFRDAVGRRHKQLSPPITYFFIFCCVFDVSFVK